MGSFKEIKTVFIGDIAFNTDITPTKEQTSIGGAAYYSSVGAISAHREISKNPGVGIVAPVGDDFDISYLLNKNINSQGVLVIQGGKTCRFILTQHSDNTREFSAKRFVAEQVNSAIFPQSYFSAKYIHLSTSLPQNYVAWIEFLSCKTNAIISADAFETFALQFPQESISALNMSDLIFINEAEANILEKHGTVRTDIPWVLKKGRGGATYIHGTKEINVKAAKVNAIETTGAGDVLAGAFLALLSNGYEIEQALTTAVNIASLSVTQFGVEHLIS